MENKSVKIWTIILTLVYLLSFVAAVFMCKSAQLLTLTVSLSQKIVSTRMSSPATEIFIQSFGFDLITLIFIFLTRISRVGIVLDFAVILFLGMIRGAVAYGAAFDSGIHGTVFFAIVLLPGIVCSSAAVLMAAASSAVICSNRKNTINKGGLQRLKALSVYIFLIIFSSGLDVTSAEVYKALM